MSWLTVWLVIGLAIMELIVLREKGASGYCGGCPCCEEENQEKDSSREGRGLYTWVLRLSPKGL